MAWYAKLEGVDGGAKDGASNTLMLAEMDSFNFEPAKEDEVLVAFESGDKDGDVDGRDFLIWQRNTGAQPDVDDLSLLPAVQEPVQDLSAVDDDADKPSLVVKFDIGGPTGALE